MSDEGEGECPREWTWWVETKLSNRSRSIQANIHAPHRAAAKKEVVATAEAMENEVEWFGDVRIPPETWDCIECRIHEGMRKLPNMETKWDWECSHCGTRLIGHPTSPEVVLR